MIQTLLQEFRPILRRLGRAPGFTAAALLTLTLGIGASSAVISLLGHVLIQRATFPGQRQMVLVSPRARNVTQSWSPLSGRQFLELQKDASTFQGLAGLRDSSSVLRTDAGAETQPCALVTPGGLTALGVPFHLGGDFPAEEAPGGASATILPYTTWAGRFGGDPAILGRRLDLDGRRVRVAGVLAKGVQLPVMGEGAAFYLPLEFRPQERDRNEVRCCWVLGRLKSGATLSAARSELRSLVPGLLPSDERGQDWTLDIRYWEDLRRAALGPAMGALGALGLFSLLLTCANVAGLNLARLDERASDFAVRSALGAGRGSLLRDAFLETLVLALAASACSFLLAAAVLRKGVQLLGEDPSLLALDPGLLLGTLAMAFLAALLTGLVPALLGSRPDLRALLHQGASTSLGGPRMPWRRALVGLQVALATLLLAGSGLMGRALWRLRRADLGLDPRNVLTAQFSAPDGPAAPLFDRVMERLRALPGVTAAGVAMGMPLYNRSDHHGYWAEGERPEADQATQVAVSTGYFPAMGIRFDQGRSFQDLERGSCVITSPLARKHWPGQNPLGRRISLVGPQGPWMTIVGVAQAHRYDDVTRPPTEQIYTSFREEGAGYYALLLRTSGRPEALAPALRRAMDEVLPGVPLDRIEPLESVVARNLDEERLLGELLAAAGIVAALLAALGIHGVCASLVQQRRRELGLRMALGARREQVLGQVLRQSLLQAGLGLGVGCGAALALVRVLQSLTRIVKPGDLLGILIPVLGLCLLALAASLVPALRAVRIEPAEALRSE